jgi:hypothetical protein
LEAATHEDKNQIELLEGHLARRVKECALLHSTAEEQSNELGRLQRKLQEKEKAMEELQAGLEQEQTTLSQLEKELGIANELIEDQRIEIETFGEFQQRLEVLEKLFHQASQVLGSKRIFFEETTTGRNQQLQKSFGKEFTPCFKNDLLTPSTTSQYLRPDFFE